MLTALQTATPAEAAIATGGVLPAGPVGPVGPQGIQGPQGNPGPVGASGPPGVGGLSAWGTEAPWAPSTVYNANAPASLVYFNGATYVCVVSHTSTGSFDPSKWQVVVQVTAPLTLSWNGFNPASNVSSALTLTGTAAYGGGLIFQDTAYIGLWSSGNGTTLNISVNGTSSGFGSSTGQYEFQQKLLTLNAGADTSIVLGQDSGATHYNILSLNGKTTDGGGTQNVGFVAGATSDTALYYEAGSHAFLVGTSNTERMLLDSSGRVTIGGTANQSIKVPSLFEINDTTSSEWQLATAVWSGGVGGWVSATSRGGVIGTHAISQANDFAFYLEGDGDSGSAFQTAASIGIQLDGTPSSTSMPGRWVFDTTPAGSTTPLERMRIDSAGRHIIKGMNTSYAGGAISNYAFAGFQLIQTASTYDALQIYSSGANNTANIDLVSTAGSDPSVQSAVASGTWIGNIDWVGSDGTNYGLGARMVGIAPATWSSSSHPVDIFFRTVPVGSTGAIERMRISNNGSVNIGVAGATLPSLFSSTPAFQTAFTNTTVNPNADFQRFSADSNGAWITFVKSRGTTIGSNVTVQNNDGLMYLASGGYDATATPALQLATLILGSADAAPTAGVVAGRLGFSTSTTGGANLEALRIDSAQRIMLGGGASQTGLNSSNLPVQLNTLSTTIMGIQRWDNSSNPGGVWIAKSRGGTIGTHQPVAALDELAEFMGGGSDGAEFVFAGGAQIYDDGAVSAATASGSFTTSTTSITLTGPGDGYITVGAAVWDATANARVGTVSSQNGSTLVLTAPSLINSSGSSDSLQFTPPNTINGRISFPTAQVQYTQISATASFTTASTTISLAQALPSWAVSGTYVYDRTSLAAIGKVASGAGTTTLHLQSASLINSSGSSDTLQFQSPTSTLTEVMRLDSTGMVTIQPSSYWLSFAQLYIPSNNSSPWNILVSQQDGATTDPCFVLFQKSRGLYGSPDVAVVSGDGILQMAGKGMDASATPVARRAAEMYFTVDAAPTAGSVPGRIAFTTASSGSANPTERLRIDSGGRTFFGRDNNSFGTIPNTANLNPSMVICGISYGGSSILMANFGANGNDGNLNFLKSRAGTVQSAAGAAVVSGDGVMDMNFSASDGTNWIGGAFHACQIDGTVATNSVPMRFVWYTGVNGSTERLRIDSGGSVNIGNAGPILPAVFGNTPQFQISSLGTVGGAAIALNRYSADANAAFISFIKSRGTTIGSNVSISSGDDVGYIDAGGYDATATPVLREMAYIDMKCDAAPTAGSVPGRIAFATSASGNSSPTEVLRLDSNQQIDIRVTPNTSRATITTSNQSGVSVANGSNAAICPGFRGFIIIDNETGSGTGNGDIAIYLVTTSGGSILVGQAGSGSWVAPTTTPAAGKCSVANGNPWNVYNNVGNTATFKIFAINQT